MSSLTQEAREMLEKWKRRVAQDEAALMQAQRELAHASDRLATSRRCVENLRNALMKTDGAAS